MGALKNRREQFECKAHGALHGHSTKLATKRQPSRRSTRRPRHIIWTDAEASTAQRSVRQGGGKAAGNPPAYSLRVNRIAQQVFTGGQHG